jgi:putative ABC transport system permease protein
MLKNFLRIAIRNMKKSKLLSIINILGLAVGMGCALLIALHVIDELGYENFHSKADRIYRIVQEEYIGSPAPLASALKRNLLEIEETVIVENYTRRSKKLFSTSEKRYYEERILLAEPSFFDIFSYPMVRGNPETALDDPYAILLTETTARKYFGDDDPIGQSLTLENTWDLTVTGILKDIPETTHLKFDMLAPFPFNIDKNRPGHVVYQKWGQANYVTYILLSKNAPFDKKALEARINRAKNEAGGQRYNRLYSLQPIKDIHLGSNLRAEFETNSSTRSVVFYAVIGAIILLIACINSMNLSTARSIKRSKEVGIRKVVGANRSQLIMQFFGESFITAMVSLMIALVLVVLFLPAFNNLTGKDISFADSPLSILVILFFITIITGLGAGIYPALFLSRFQPVKTIRSRLSGNSEGKAMRQILVLVQFCLSIVFVFCTFVVWDQLNYVKGKNLGMNDEHVINIPLYKEVQDKYELIKSDFLRNPGVMNTAASNFPALAPYNHGLYWEGMNPDDDKHMFWFSVDFDFIETLGLELIQGRNFSLQLASDTVTAYIFNEAAVREFGENFIKNRRFSVFGSESKAPVIGVVKDFHFMSLHDRIAPVLLCVYPRYFNHISVRTNLANIPGVLSHLREVWKDYLPNRPFEYFFLDARFDRMYKSEERLGKLFSYFAGLAVFISCLGLFALASFMAEQRTKEIGVRKVLGASVPNITFLLSKEFLKWVLLANVIAWPVAFTAMERWLANFAYRTTIGIDIFAASALLALAISFITVSYQSIKAAVSDPVNSLRYE